MSPDVLSDRPNHPLVVKCAYDGTSRRVTFPSAQTCRLESMRHRVSSFHVGANLQVEECFSLFASPFSLTYTDDDGEDFVVKSDDDLTEAILYFGDDENQSSYSNAGPSSQKITLRVQVILEYDGPSLSDTSSLLSFQSGLQSSQSEDSWTSSRRSGSYSGDTNIASSVKDDGETEYENDTRTENGIAEDVRRLTLDDAMAGSRVLTGPQSEPAPLLLANSELGSRWLREQTHLATRRIGHGTRAKRRDSEVESLGSDEESFGDIALVKDAKGSRCIVYKAEVRILLFVRDGKLRTVFWFKTAVRRGRSA